MISSNGSCAAGAGSEIVRLSQPRHGGATDTNGYLNLLNTRALTIASNVPERPDVKNVAILGYN
ncbi:hypothetical protein C7401_1575 [Paraburkholderia unamae]|uniref:hypothetical protein n=1 Tax=Paraburkholderia unamae TaxID=219649 RepID=UPI000DC5CA07|nr:hypothetical protein [Paraburkholderia unamae]RAR47911.1 hypothetical protein C7401_1575 [Paraburkholderia unamae]